MPSGLHTEEAHLEVPVSNPNFKTEFNGCTKLNFQLQNHNINHHYTKSHLWVLLHTSFNPVTSLQPVFLRCIVM